ncbi:MAG: hypothetical protein JNM95_01625 [Chitinophagaceae bacterium]|nr:hypothetical protein [Chitinophagaceae bacterium]
MEIVIGMNLEYDVSSQYVEPAVSKEKFDRELNLFLSNKGEYIKRGIILVDAIFPSIDFIFLAQKLTPMAVVFAVRVNFNNYDVEPPSVTFIDPLSKLPIPAMKCLTHFQKRIGLDPNGQIQTQALLQFETPFSKPFLCFAGIREYHNHPFHTGDSWLLYRKRGEGTLSFIIEALYNYGIAPIESYNLQVQVQSPIVQLGQNPINISE